ncbi:uncharacterized protein LOC110718915 isoform X1 [Chenopodium quinoa]|uniref:uncharacterized protein LOC110718915 isoform X1 n=1 Tax=Chenopodium quinoa TaxID=63459 RepID=UPI000B79585F|nr:uncharacterized protein LOC110718915 isoform X1 [Chenopodium quinoa]
MFSANLSTSPSLITPKTSTSNLKPYFLSPRSVTIQSRAPDFSAASSSSSSPDWFQFPDISGPRIPRENDAVSEGSSSSSSRDSNDSMLNGKREKKWSRNRESYLRDDSEPLPLPMTFSDITPTSLEEIDRRLRCDPQLEDMFKRYQPGRSLNRWRIKNHLDLSRNLLVLLASMFMYIQDYSDEKCSYTLIYQNRFTEKKNFYEFCYGIFNENFLVSDLTILEILIIFVHNL